jgi:hypothetical protein
LSLFATVAPYTLDVSHGGAGFSLSEAYAKGGGGKGGGGNGGGGGKGSGGNGGGNNGGGNNGNGGGNNGKSGNAKAKAATTGVSVNPSLPELQVRHRRGLTEAIVTGRYIMRDARGRTIINREATAADRRRIERLLR